MAELAERFPLVTVVAADLLHLSESAALESYLENIKRVVLLRGYRNDDDRLMLSANHVAMSILEKGQEDRKLLVQVN